MLVKDIIAHLDAKVIAGEASLENEIDNCYIGDLLSWVMGNGTQDCVWVTIQGHVNIIAVALLISASCVVLAEGSDAEAATIKKADDEGIPILKTNLSAYQVAKKLCELGV